VLQIYKEKGRGKGFKRYKFLKVGVKNMKFIDLFCGIGDFSKKHLMNENKYV